MKRVAFWLLVTVQVCGFGLAAQSTAFFALWIILAPILLGAWIQYEREEDA